jgi:RNA polymerase sigma-70 factor (ECF subfamily)
MRYLSRRKTILLSLEAIDGDYLLSPYQTPEEKVLSAELISKIEAAIQKLPPQCKQVFTLIKVDGIRYKDAAQILNISLKTVEAQMAIAIKRIRLAVDTDLAHFRN